MNTAHPAGAGTQGTAPSAVPSDAPLSTTPSTPRSLPLPTDDRLHIVTVQPPPVVGFRPGHTDGDADFDGHGPFVHLVAQVRRSGGLLLLDTSAFFQETAADWTTFEGTLSEPFLDVDRAWPGWRIQAVRGPAYQDVQLRLAGYGHHHFHYGEDGFVRSLVLRGDSDGGVFGGRDRPEIVAMHFNPLRLELVRAPDPRARPVPEDALPRRP